MAFIAKINLVDASDINAAKHIYEYIEDHLMLERRGGSEFATSTSQTRDAVLNEWKSVQDMFLEDKSANGLWVQYLTEWVNKHLAPVSKLDATKADIFKSRQNLLTSLRKFNLRRKGLKEGLTITVNFEGLDAQLADVMNASDQGLLKASLIQAGKWEYFKRSFVRESLSFVLANNSAFNDVINKTISRTESNQKRTK